MKLDFCRAEFHEARTLLSCLPEYIISHRVTVDAVN